MEAGPTAKHGCDRTTVPKVLCSVEPPLPLGADAAFLLMIPGTFACSCAFMLPSGTGPNAVVFGSGQVTIPQMSRTGLWLNIISVVVVTLVMYLIAIPVFGITSGVPIWAK